MDFMWLKLCVFYVFLQVLSSQKLYCMGVSVDLLFSNSCKNNRNYTFTKIPNFERFYQTPPTGVQADDFLNRKDL